MAKQWQKFTTKQPLKGKSGRLLGHANGKTSFIEQQRQFIYDLYFTGSTVADIKQQLKTQFNQDVKLDTIYLSLKTYREEQERALTELIESKISDKAAHLEYWINNLELTAPLLKSNPSQYLKCVELITDLLWKQLTLNTQSGNGNPLITLTDAGKQTFIQELQKLQGK